MKLTKRVIAVVLVAGLLATVLALPQAAEAGGRHWHRGGGHGHGYHRSGHSYFWPGLAVGAVTGIVVGSILAPRVYAAPPVVYQPAPAVIYQPAPVVVQPAPVCSSYWVSTHWNGYQWVPGYWAQVCH